MFSASDIAGFIASALVLATFAMSDTRLLRLTAICSNMAFIIYGAMNGLLPILGLHVILLPLNFLRLVQAERAGRASPQKTSKAVRLATDALILGEAMRKRPRSRSPDSD